MFFVSLFMLVRLGRNQQVTAKIEDKKKSRNT
jgi:hypothetical protein